MRIAALVASFLIVASSGICAELEQKAEKLTLSEALDRVIELNPTIAAAREGVSAGQERVVQAGLLPNPELELEVENFGGTGELSGFDTAEDTLVISQEIQLGGKRRHRRGAAEAELSVVRLEQAAVRIDIEARTKMAFFAVVAAQQREDLMLQMLDLAERFAHTVEMRVEAGAVSPVEGIRSQISVAQARLERARALREREAAVAQLAALWGGRRSGDLRAVGELPQPGPPPSVSELLPMIAVSPGARLAELAIQQQQRNLELEDSFKIPNLTLAAGPRYVRELSETVWVAGLSVQLPIFDRNQGARAAAGYDVERARREAEAVLADLGAELATRLAELAAASLEAIVSVRDIVPAAQQAFASAEIGYREGKLDFPFVLEAQKALFEARSFGLESMERYALARVELERLLGRTIEEGSTSPQPEPKSSRTGDVS
ncbi:MAG: TolC family protein [bacterium]|nr:TolC family protein [bacterium]